MAVAAHQPSPIWLWLPQWRLREEKAPQVAPQPVSPPEAEPTDSPDPRDRPLPAAALTVALVFVLHRCHLCVTAQAVLADRSCLTRRRLPLERWTPAAAPLEALARALPAPSTSQNEA